MFFKIGVFKNFSILEPLPNNKVVGLLLTLTAAATEFLGQQIIFCS